jgi:uncharacterized protein YoxC
MNWEILILAISIIIIVIVLAIVLYNFMLLLSEINKRLVYVISDVLGSIDLSTPSIDSLNPDQKSNFEDILEEIKEDKAFNPHDVDVDSMMNNNDDGELS